MSMFKTSAVSRLLGVLVLATILVGSTTGYLLLQSTGEPIGAGEGWLTGWAKRVKLTIDNTDIDATLSNFPILLYLGSSSGRLADNIIFIFNEVGANKLKIAVTTADGTTQCYVEVEKWRYDSGIPANSKAWLWVKVPSISATVDTDLYLYYDNTKADNTAYVGDPESTPAMAVWDANFKGVYHLKDKTTSTVADSGSFDHDGAKLSANNPLEATGKIDKGQDFSSDWINLGTTVDFRFTGAFTLECWIKMNVINVWENFISSQNAQTGNGYAFQNNGAGKISLLHYGLTPSSYTSLGSVVVATWYHVVGVYDGSNLRVYINGVQDNSVAVTGSLTVSDRPCYLGVLADYPPYREWMNGIIDEGRLSNVARTAAWTKATYETGRDHLLDWGSEETPNTAPTNGAGSIMNIEILRPNAVGDEQNIAYQEPNDGLSHYLKVDEIVADEDTTYLEPASPAGTWQRDLYNVEDLGPAGIINFVKVYGRARTYAASPDRATLKLAVKTGGTAYESAEILLTSIWTTYSNQWTTNPKTGVAWTWSDVDSLQIGENICRPGGTQSTYFTQVYVEVNAGMDDLNNLYAQKKWYTGSSVHSDANGYADIHYCEFRLLQGATVRARFQYHEDDNTFNIQEGSAAWDLDISNSVATRSGTTITISWKFKPQWDATEELGLSIELYVVDAAGASNTNTAQTNYFDVVARLVTSGFTSDHGRINVGGTTTISGTVYYRNDPASNTASTSYPPDAEFTSVSIHNSVHASQAAATTTVNGAFSVSFAIPNAVQSNTYHAYINMADTDYTDADAVDADTTAVIGDRIKITACGIVGNTIDVDTGGKVWYTTIYEYDSTQFTGSSGALFLNGTAMTWATDRWTYAFPYLMSGSQAVFVVTSVLDTQYGLTVLNNVAGNIVLNWATMEITISKP